ncbi:MULTISPECIES: response regulator transcription factor [Brevibacillus]|jgi:Response regulators consisting of a CheY-like receiver domain and a winged-helix DNA-binding domain|uniref:Heme response regulator HssR n=1 Tax=Brevibacillus parabrevis TaxID=54914 RepID=A0A4Y3PN61_BREPA|nr:MULTISPECIES: response regulator transcription factor [Brevibacillus]MBU8716143.1 response regulator transcription factor [Brevibacillus parabrevis]MDH6353355.1 two-component system OmpR family response regulator [Brevibacillus sp. 1238]MDR5001596.1 response regulator transcription factor [Brevibacillus parabrevis]MED2253482.1 response regulator transcription factor [Brevibacillus parabrevis]NRQ56393.1 response regulator transcription factor [Brevibacillus sp. HD1.4A]
MKMTILVADDDAHIRELLRFYLEKEGYRVLAAADGSQASVLLEQEKVQLAIVDVMMPGKNGWELCKEIREYYDIPVIMLTAKGEVRDKEKGFLAGTDDYLTKPFEPTELLYRIRALLRRYQMVSKQVIVMHDTVIDRMSHVVKIKDEVMHLPLKEFELLAQLASFPDRTFTRDQLLDLVWGGDNESDSRTIDVHIKRLREKFTDKTDDFVICTVRGLGYKLEVRGG